MRCGLSVSASVELSTLAVPMCAMRSTTKNESTVWLVFHESTPLPRAVSFSTSPMQHADVVLCSAREEDFEWFCSPTDSETLKESLDVEMRRQVAAVASSTAFGASQQSAGNGIIDTFANTTTSQPSSSNRLASTAFASVYYAFHASGATLHRIELSSAIPHDVTQRLDASQLKFKSITGFLQRVLLWDTGYVIVPRKGSSTKMDVVPVTSNVDGGWLIWPLTDRISTLLGAQFSIVLVETPPVMR